MANSTPSILLLILALFLTIHHTPGFNPRPGINAFPTDIQSLNFTIRLRTDPEAIRIASDDYGNLAHEAPYAVLYPSSINDIIELVEFSYGSSTPFTIATRGHGHSVRGQAMARGGVVVDMAPLRGKAGGVRVSSSPSLGYYADVGGEQLWIDVLRAGLQHGLAPVSWTDYLHLTVGGTLSNAGISGQSFLHGPQISNVLELDVITGGLGQFGIITRARIVLDKAPTRTKWARLLYSNFSEFSRDQEHLISITSPNYVEGFLITNLSTIDDWRSSFSSPARQSDIVSQWRKRRLLYSIELVRYYDDQTANTIDKEFQALLKELNFIPGFIFSRDVPLIDFLTRVGNKDNEERGGLNVHPWLNLFIPKSRIRDFNAGVIVNMIPKLKHTPGFFIFYPLNKTKWNDRASAVTPDDEDIFYYLGLLHSGRANESMIFDKFNDKILRFCKKHGIKVKEYLPYYKPREDWREHFGSKWGIFRRRKMVFDPKMILSPGQRIFN